MKNQYFGDVRDLFKYDLIQFILKNDTALRKCTWVPMLTQDDSSNHGEIRHGKPRAGSHNCDLQTFLANYHESRANRDIQHLCKFEFFRKSLSIFPNKEFTHITRSDYFNKIPSSLLRNKLIFVDPDTGTDIGIENTSIRGKEDRYIMNNEIGDLFARMGTGSALMIYQHHRRKKGETREIFLKNISEGLKQNHSIKPLYISDSQIALFFLVKTLSKRVKLNDILIRYQKEYPDLVVTK